MRSINELSGAAIILFLVMLIPGYLEESNFKAVNLLGFSVLLVSMGVILSKIKMVKKRRRGYLKG